MAKPEIKKVLIKDFQPGMKVRHIWNDRPDPMSPIETVVSIEQVTGLYGEPMFKYRTSHSSIRRATPNFPYELIEEKAPGDDYMARRTTYC